MRARSFCSALAAGLITALPIGARAELSPTDRALPCNELCRAWMSWAPKPEEEKAGSWLRPTTHDLHGNLGAPEPAPRSRASAIGPAAVIQKRAESAKRGRTRPGAGAFRTTERPSPRIAHVLPRSPMPAPKPKAFGHPLDAGGSALKNDQPAGGIIVPSRDDPAARLWDRADAAVLATPLYRPLGAVGIDDGRIEQGSLDRPASGLSTIETENRPSDPAASERDGSQEHISSHPEYSRPGIPAPEGPPPPEVPPAWVATTEAARPRATNSNAAAAPVLPPSELERLDRVESRTESGAALRPSTLSFLLGGLALASLVGFRRSSRFHGE